LKKKTWRWWSATVAAADDNGDRQLWRPTRLTTCNSRWQRLVGKLQKLLVTKLEEYQMVLVLN